MSKTRTLEAILKSSRRAILLGIGGGGDIVGTIPTAKLLENFGVGHVMGGLSWERSVIDPVPGPRKFNETRNARKINDTVWYSNHKTTTSTGVKFAESRISEIYGKETLLVDVNYGVKEVVNGLLDAAEKLDADLIVGIDVGGDAIAFGNEPGIMSPLADAIMTASLSELEKRIDTIMGVFGFGCDGELTMPELEKSIRKIAKEGGLLGSWGITHETLKELEKVVEIVPTEASRLPVEAAKGIFDRTTIRSGRRSVSLSIISTITFYLTPSVVFEKISKPARTVSECRSLAEANEALHKLGLKTELDYELERLCYGSGPIL
ncbi:MAG TPA: DUF1152 domain-containing protein [Thermodesulfobacteriota bacterium]